ATLDLDAWDARRTAEAHEALDRLAAHPAAALADLRATAHGCRLLLFRWQELGQALAADGFWDGDECDEAIRLQGSLPLDDDRATGEDVDAYLTCLRNFACDP